MVGVIKKLFITITAVALAGVYFYFYKGANPSWRDFYKKDLQAIHDILKENHPGFYDNDNLGFNAWLVTGYQQALSKSEQIHSLTDYFYGLQFFVAGFKDGHLSLGYDSASIPSEWPGFCVGYLPGYRTGFGDETEEQAESFVVVYSEKKAIPVGAQLIACDGEQPRAWLEKNVSSYVDMRNADASWVKLAPYLSFWQNTAFIKRPQSYVFTIDSKEQKEQCVWEKVTPAYYFSKARTRDNIPLLANIKDIGSQQVWVTLPSFHPEAPEQKEALKKVIDSIKNYNKYDIIIFDVRGNRGGNSHYGTQLLKNLYGETYCNAAFKKLRANQYVEWRASRENTEYLKTLLAILEKQFGPGDIVTDLSVIASEMEKNLAAGNPFYRALNSLVELSEFGISQNPLRARIVVITDSYCASACLVFLDELYALEPAFQIGLPTSVDTCYMECRDVLLPSGYATLHFPIKVFRNRRRKSNEAWLPSRYLYDVYNDEKIREVVYDAL